MSTRRRRTETPRGGQDDDQDQKPEQKSTNGPAEFDKVLARNEFQSIVRRSSTVFRLDHEFQESPRQVLFGFICICGVLAIGVAQSNAEPSASTGFRSVILALLFVISVYCILNTRDGLMIRPHPAFWRVLHGGLLWYFLIVCAMLALPPALGLELVSLAFPGLSAGAKAKDEGDRGREAVIGNDHLACEITFDTVYRQITSLWFTAHVIGWFAKMCVFRNFRVCVCYSVAFELMELSLQFLIPEFQECWWDSLIIDWALSNMLGMYLGWLLLRWLNVREYRWTRFSALVGVKEKAKRVVQQLMPYCWSSYTWNELDDPIIYAMNTICWVSSLFVELNSFFMIHAFAMPAQHWFHVARQVFLSIASLPAVAEWYEYVHGRSDRIGQNVWLMNMLVLMEFVMAIRYCVLRQRFVSVWPPVGVWLPWGLFFLLHGSYFAWHCKLKYRDRVTEKKLPPVLRVLRAVSYLPLVGLAQYWAY